MYPISTLVFKSCIHQACPILFFSLPFVPRHLPQLRGFCSVLLLLWWDGFFYPNPAQRYRCGKEKSSGGWRRSTDTLSTAEELTASRWVCTVLPSACWEETERFPIVRSLWRSLAPDAIPSRAKSGKCGKNGQPTLCLTLKGFLWGYKIQFLHEYFGGKGVMSKDL